MSQQTIEWTDAEDVFFRRLAWRFDPPRGTPTFAEIDRPECFDADLTIWDNLPEDRHEAMEARAVDDEDFAQSQGWRTR